VNIFKCFGVFEKKNEHIWQHIFKDIKTKKSTFYIKMAIHIHTTNLHLSNFFYSKKLKKMIPILEKD